MKKITTLDIVITTMMIVMTTIMRLVRCTRLDLNEKFISKLRVYLFSCYVPSKTKHKTRWCLASA